MIFYTQVSPEAQLKEYWAQNRFPTAFSECKEGMEEGAKRSATVAMPMEVDEAPAPMEVDADESAVAA